MGTIIKVIHLSWKLFLDHFRFHKSQVGLEIDNPVTCGFTCIVIPHENIHATRVVTLSAEELGTRCINSLRGTN